MKSLAATIKDMYRNDRGVIIWMLLLLMVGGVLVVVALMSLAPGAADGVIVRYSDASGYAKGGWGYMLGFAAMGALLMVGHALLAIRIYEKRGGAIAILFVWVSIFLVLLGLLVLLRLVGEG